MAKATSMAAGCRVLPFFETLCTALEHLFVGEVGQSGWRRGRQRRLLAES
ncbi:MAG: hypothetical protein ABI593_01305 [Betaproteobacteria bacterium]